MCRAEVQEGAKFCPSCGAEQPRSDAQGAEDDPFIGQVIAKNFRIVKLLGVGGMGKVYKALQLSLDKYVVIKVLHDHFRNDPQLVQRFQREARAASRLNHPNSIQVIDFGQTDDGILFMAIEFLNGTDLFSILHREGPLNAIRIARIMVQVCSALSEAHDMNVIHRDLKPENIMVEDRRGRKDIVKVLDFGIAKIQDPDEAPGQALTQAGMVCGTPEYMSPEQARGLELDLRSDLYALGVLVYQLVTGQLPFQADTPIGIVTKHILEEPPPPRAKYPLLQIPAAMETIILKAMQKEPESRYQSAAEMGADFERIIESGTHAIEESAKVPPADHQQSNAGVPDDVQDMTSAPTIDGDIELPSEEEIQQEASGPSNHAQASTAFVPMSEPGLVDSTPNSTDDENDEASEHVFQSDEFDDVAMPSNQSRMWMLVLAIPAVLVSLAVTVWVVSNPPVPSEIKSSSAVAVGQQNGTGTSEDQPKVPDAKAQEQKPNEGAQGNMAAAGAKPEKGKQPAKKAKTSEGDVKKKESSKGKRPPKQASKPKATQKEKPSTATGKQQEQPESVAKGTEPTTASSEKKMASAPTVSEKNKKMAKSLVAKAQMSLISSKDIESAYKQLKKAKALDPTNYQSILLISRYWTIKGNGAKACAAMKDYIYHKRSKLSQAQAQNLKSSACSGNP